MNKTKILISGIVVWIVSTIYAFLTCGWLFKWVYTLPPIIWKDQATMMSTSNLISTSLIGILVGIIFALIYAFLYKGIPGRGVKKGIIYGLVVWLVGAFSGMISMPFYMTINTTVVIYWLISGLLIQLINGAIVGSIYKE